MTLGPAYGAAAAAHVTEYIAIKQTGTGQDVTLGTSNATAQWTGVNFQSDADNFTLASHVLLCNIGGKFKLDYHIVVRSSGGTTIPFWAFATVEIDEGTGGSWSPVTGSLAAQGMTTDTGGGQTILNLSAEVITSFAAGDSLRIRIRRSSGAATTVKTDGANGGNWNLTKMAD